MKKIVTIALTLTLSLGLWANTQAQDELYIYQHSGVTDTLQLDAVRSVSHSRTDLQGRQQRDYVVMTVTMLDATVRSYLLSGLDSVVMSRDGHRTPLLHFVGGMKGVGSTQRQAPHRTSMEGDFMASAATVDFFWTEGDRIYLEDGTCDDPERVFYHEPDKAVADFYFTGGNISGNAVTVYYPGQTPPTTDGRKVQVKKDQSQSLPNTTQHIGVSGDCGTAVAEQRDGTYYFDLDHHAAYLCFLPYIANDLGRTVLKKITVHSDKAIAGIFSLSTSGLVLDSDPSHSITLTTGGEDGFVLPQQAGQSVSAYMVIAPQSESTRLTCEFTVYDNLLQSTGVYTKTVDLAAIERNQVYVIKANCNNYVVDLGLPVKFLNHNYGAFAPEEFGGYYAFGELNEKGTYSSSNLVTNVSALGTEIRLTENDIAHVKLGGGFSTPTIAEWRMLVDGCDTWTWMTVNGKNGCLVTGPNGNKLFLPAGGYRRDGSKELNERGIYHSSSLFKDDGVKEWNFSVKSDARTFNLDTDYYDGESIRPVVSDGVQMTDGTTVQVMTDSAQCRFDVQQATLFGTLHGYDKAKTTSALEVGFLVGTDAQVAAGEGTMVPATEVTGDGRYSAVFNMPKDTAYYYRAYVREQDGSTCFVNTLQFGRAYADLGLPSGNLWSSINLGCTKPEDKGVYYAWGETATKPSYSKANHRWYDGHIYTFPDGCLRDIQATCYDVAAVEWGGTWVTPNRADLQELVDNCSVTEETVNGMPGYRLTSTVDGYTDRSIFVPKSGWWSTALKDYRKYSYFTTSELTDAASYKAYGFENGALYATWDRYNGLAVRPVNKSNAMSTSGKRMYIRTLPAGKCYNGTDAETDTLKAVIRGYSADGTTTGIVWWPQGGDPTTVTYVNLTSAIDANGYVSTVITNLTPGTTYYYAGYVHDGTTYSYGETLHVDAIGLVDLGLSVKWANMNIGAVNAEDGGSFYAWGATETFNNTSQQYTANKDITPNSGHDIATNNWGTGFRMPTIAEWQELASADNCTWTWDTRDGLEGYRVTSRKNGNSIFLPAPGIYDWNENYHKELNNWAFYWASTVYSTSYSWRMWFKKNQSPNVNTNNEKNQGFSTRAVESLYDEIYTIGMKRNVRDAAEVDTLVSELRHVSGRTIESGFILGETADLTAETTTKQIFTLETVVNGVNKFAVTGLPPGKTYYYRAYFKDGDEYTYGDVKKFELLETIDLGLPSGTLWTNINTGADYVEDFGDYYAWGETTTKNIYNQSTYEFCQNGSYTDIGSDIGGTKYDAATVNMGQRWRMPTQAQCAELIANTTHEAITYNGVACWKLTGTNGNYIIFPRNSQMKEGSLNHSNMGTWNNYGHGVYPTSTQNNASDAYNMYMPNEGPSAGSGNHDEKYWGKNIRAVVRNMTDMGNGISYHVATDGCDWSIGASTATLRGHAVLSETVEGATHGFVVGTIKEVDTPTPADGSVVTIEGTNSEFTYDYPYEGGARYYRTFLKVDNQYYFGEVKAVTAADLLDVEFNTASEAFDGTFSGIPSSNISKTGSFTCPYNDDYKRYEANLSGNTAAGTANSYYRVNYSSTSPFANKLAESHSIEVLAKPSEITSAESDIIANYEGGGEGIEIMNNKIDYCAYFGSSYIRYYADMTLTANQYYHIVAVWDRENAQVRVYVDGNLKLTAENVPTTMVMPEKFYSFIVGGQPNDNNVIEAWKGYIGFARIYSGSLTDTQVQTLYNGLTK